MVLMEPQPTDQVTINLKKEIKPSLGKYTSWKVTMDPGWNSRKGLIFFFRVDCRHSYWLWFHKHHKCTSTIAKREWVIVGCPITKELCSISSLRSCTMDPTLLPHNQSFISRTLKHSAVRRIA